MANIGGLVKRGLEAVEAASDAGRRATKSPDNVVVDPNDFMQGVSEDARSRFKNSVTRDEGGVARQFQLNATPDEVDGWLTKDGVEGFVDEDSEWFVDEDSEWVFENLDLDYEDGALPNTLNLKGKVKDGVLDLEDLDEESKLLLDWAISREWGEYDIPISLDLNDILDDATEIPEFVRTADGRVVPLKSPIGFDNNPRASRLDSQRTLDETPSMIYQLDSDGKNASRTVSHVFNQDTGVRNFQAAAQVPDEAGEVEQVRLYDEALNDVRVLSPEHQTNAELESSGWAAETIKYASTLSDRSLKKFNSTKSLYNVGLLDKDSDFAKKPIIFRNVGSDALDDEGLPLSFKHGKEVGMHGGSKYQTTLFRYDERLVGVPEARQELERQMRALGEMIGDPDKFRRDLEEIFQRNVVRTKEGSFFEFELKPDIADDFNEYFAKEFGNSTKDPDAYQEITSSLIIASSHAKAQFETGFIVTGKSPLVLRNYELDMTPSRIAGQLETMKRFKKSEYEETLKLIKENGSDVKSDKFQEAKEALHSLVEQEGFDHILYNNTVDSAGGMPSVIVWRDDTIEILGMREQGNSIGSYTKAFSALLPVVAGAALSGAPANEAIAAPVNEEAVASYSDPTLEGALPNWYDEKSVDPKSYMGQLMLFEGLHDKAEYLTYRNKDGERVTEKKLTVGHGHLVKDGEINKETGEPFKEGDVISNEYARELFEQDFDTAQLNALKEARRLGLMDDKFIEPLTHVMYQLGPTGWKGFEDTRKILKKAGKAQGKERAELLEDAARVVVNSKWNKQTENRSLWFQNELRKYAMSIK